MVKQATNWKLLLIGIVITALLEVALEILVIGIGIGIQASNLVLFVLSAVAGLISGFVGGWIGKDAWNGLWIGLVGNSLPPAFVILFLTGELSSVQLSSMIWLPYFALLFAAAALGAFGGIIGGRIRSRK